MDILNVSNFAAKSNVCQIGVALLFLVVTAFSDDKPRIVTGNPADGAIAGRVTDAETHSPVSNVTVSAYLVERDYWQGWAWDWPSGGGMTDEHGNYIVQDLPAGIYRLEFSLFGSAYADMCYSNAPSLASATDIAVEDQKVENINVSMQAGGTLAGMVFAPCGQAPASNVTVSASILTTAGWQNVRSTETGIDGAYLFQRLPVGGYRFVFSDPMERYGQMANDRDIIAGEQPESLDVVLAFSATLAGSLTVQGSGDPAAGVAVEALRGAEIIRSTTTDLDGNYSIAQLPAGFYRLRFARDSAEFRMKLYGGADCFSAATPVLVDAGDELTGLNAALQQVDVCAADASISGQVTSARDGVGLPGIEVLAYTSIGDDWLFAATATTDAEGLYALANLPAASYAIEFIDNGKTYSRQVYGGAVDLADGTPVIVEAGASVGEIDMALPDASVISGTVSRFGEPAELQGITVTAYRLIGFWWEVEQSADTDAQGMYSLEGLPSGEYRIEFIDPSGNHVTKNIGGEDVVDNGNNIELAPGETAHDVNATLKTAALISGQVVCNISGVPLPEISVEALYQADDLIWDVAARSYTDQDGYYTVGGLTGGMYRLAFHDESGMFAPRVHGAQTADPDDGTTLGVEAGKHVDAIDLTMHPAGMISGRVIAPDEVTPLPDVLVTAYTQKQDQWYYASLTETDANGFYTLRGLSEGAYRVEFSHFYGDYAIQFYPSVDSLDDGADIPVALGQTVDGIDLICQPASRITGRVTGPEGLAGLAGIIVSAYRDTGSGWQVVSDAETESDGRYSINGLPAGQYRVEFRDYSEQYADEYYDGAANIESALDLDIDTGALLIDINASLEIVTP